MKNSNLRNAEFEFEAGFEKGEANRTTGRLGSRGPSCRLALALHARIDWVERMAGRSEREACLAVSWRMVIELKDVRFLGGVLYMSLDLENDLITWPPGFLIQKGLAGSQEGSAEHRESETLDCVEDRIMMDDVVATKCVETRQRYRNSKGIPTCAALCKRLRKMTEDAAVEVIVTAGTGIRVLER